MRIEELIAELTALAAEFHGAECMVANGDRIAPLGEVAAWGAPDGGAVVIGFGESEAGS